jgi:pimeloyl-ACP methyl ester carboxylesterase
MAQDPTTIVLLPGLLCDGVMWAAQENALMRLAPTVIADFSRHDNITEMARSVLDRWHGSLIVAGHSMGGRVALEVVRLAPSRVRGLALADTGIHTPSEGEPARRQVLVDLAYEKGMGALADVWLPPMVDPRRKDDQDLLAPMKEMVLRASPDQHARQIRALLDRPDARPGLTNIACPTLVMVGRQDQWSPLAQHEEIASLITGARLMVIEDAGHMSLVERPEQTTRALFEWARDVLRSTGPAQQAQ